MKIKNYHISFIIILLLFAFIKCTKDNQTINSPEDEEPPPPDYSEYFDYYPLDIGNYWEYGNIDVLYFSVEIIGDTILQNLEYRVLREIHFRSVIDTIHRFERLDSLTSCVHLFDPEFQKEFKLDSLAALSGQIYNGSRFLSREDWEIKKVICRSIDSVEIFSETFERKSLQHYGGTDRPSYYLVKGLGLTQTYFFRTGGYKLRSATIRGKVYN